MATTVDPAVLAHLEWLGFVRPTGLVVSAPALVRAGAILDGSDIDGQRLLRACVNEREFNAEEGPISWLPDFQAFANAVLGWSFSPKGYAGTPARPIPIELEVPLVDYGETLRPDYAVREMDPREGQPLWQLLVQVLEPGQEFDRPFRNGGQLEASAHGRMERLLRESRVSAGLLFNGLALRLVSAPRGESSGWLDFKVADMVQTGGRPISTALRLLLSEPRLLSLPTPHRLAALLDDSRKFQNEVSERLAEQVLHALYELLRGFQAAHDASNGELLREPLAEHPDEIYRALLIVILRLVFLLFAEERDMLPEEETFLRYYSLAGLYERLREDAALFPDTMDERYGAWAQLLVLFRLIHDGATSSAMQLPKRQGVLFDPERFKFLEGRLSRPTGQMARRFEPPLVPDGTIYRALEKLLVLEGERISYRALDVEQIGSVYETMIGFRLETAAGRSVAIRAQKKQGAPMVIDLEALLAEPASERTKWLQDRADHKLTDRVQMAVVNAATLEDLHAALLPVVDLAATPDLVPKGAMLLQPSEARRRSGSYYTPRELTEPIVRTTLQPILANLRGAEGRAPHPAQILDLKVCDPAMGSGAFLVEACRQLGDVLVEAWHAHDEVPTIPPDEDEVIYARRLIAQRCLYGVDRNPVAVDLAKVSLWLVTLAREHALTFVDHALRHGDTLLGLSRIQIEAFHWQGDAPRFQAGLEAMQVRQQVARVSDLRQRIREAGESLSDLELRELWNKAQQELNAVRLFGDLVLAAFFGAEKDKDRATMRNAYANAVVDGVANRYGGMLKERQSGERPLVPFHWEIEFPEVFERENSGFDVIVGNPPFAGKNSLAASNVSGYLDWLKQLHEDSHGNADLVAHFFRRAFHLIRKGGAFGLIATNTIAQGDTRSTGLRWICQHGGEIFAARKRVRWPGLAAVVVSVVHVMNGPFPGPKLLGQREVETITAFLFHRGGDDDPARLSMNAGKSFIGSYVLGMGFTFDDTDLKGIASPLAELRRLTDEDPRVLEVVSPYIGGEEINSSPTHAHHRYVINFGERSEEECRRRWPALMAIVEAKVKPERLALPPKNSWNRDVAERWWQFGAVRIGLYQAIAGLDRILVHPNVSQHLGFAFLPAGTIVGTPHNVFALSDFGSFCALQSRPHEVWARFFGSSMKDDLRYTPSDCFETFPFSESWETHPTLEAAGKAYYEFRAALMVRNNQGLTKTYNRFHDPDERDSEVLRLRELHAAMDRAALDAYGWSEIPTDCEFLLDYEIDEDELGYKKKPYRYRWPDDVRDEVLARLVELNAERSREEARSGATAPKKGAGRLAAKRAPKVPDSAELFS
jgi:N-6 DNA Methylase